MKRCLAVLLALFCLVACQREAPEAALRKQFAAMQAAAEQGKPADFMTGVSDQFNGSGGMDRDALRRLLTISTLGERRIGATVGPLDVKVQGDAATVNFQLLLTGGSGGLIPDQARALQVTTAWQLEGGEWRVHYANWEPEKP